MTAAPKYWGYPFTCMVRLTPTTYYPSNTHRVTYTLHHQPTYTRKNPLHCLR